MAKYRITIPHMHVYEYEAASEDEAQALHDAYTAEKWPDDEPDAIVPKKPEGPVLIQDVNCPRCGEVLAGDDRTWERCIPCREGTRGETAG